AAEFGERHLLEEAAQDFDRVTALRTLAPRFEEAAGVVTGRGRLEFARRAAFDRHLDAALALVGVPDAVVEAELHLLLDVAGEVVRRYPAGVDVERRLAPALVGVDHLQLDRVPGRAGRGADQAALPRGADAGQTPGQ